MGQYSDAMKRIREGIPLKIRKSFQRLCKRYGWRPNPLSIQFPIDAKTGKLLVPPGLKNLPMVVMHFMGNEYSQEFLDQNHMHQLRTDSNKMGSGIQVTF